jgi:hypothetical protein
VRTTSALSRSPAGSATASAMPRWFDGILVGQA